jgi:hypothetical protein
MSTMPQSRDELRVPPPAEDPKDRGADNYPAVINPGHTLASVTDKISSLVLTTRIRFGWLIGLAISFMVLQALMISLSYVLLKGVGVWGINIPVGWGFAIINFVWWIGIGHAGTLISAILLLFRQEWRTSINRFAEAMTLLPSRARAFSADAHGASVARLLDVSVPEHDEPLAAVPQPSDVGRVRGFDLCDGQLAVLVRRTHP